MDASRATFLYRMQILIIEMDSGSADQRSQMLSIVIRMPKSEVARLGSKRVGLGIWLWPQIVGWLWPHIRQEAWPSQLGPADYMSHGVNSGSHFIYNNIITQRRHIYKHKTQEDPTSYACSMTRPNNPSIEVSGVPR